MPWRKKMEDSMPQVNKKLQDEVSPTGTSARGARTLGNAAHLLELVADVSPVAAKIVGKLVHINILHDRAGPEIVAPSQRAFDVNRFPTHRQYKSAENVLVRGLEVRNSSSYRSSVTSSRRVSVQSALHEPRLLLVHR